MQLRSIVVVFCCSCSCSARSLVGSFRANLWKNIKVIFFNKLEGCAKLKARELFGGLLRICGYKLLIGVTSNVLEGILREDRMCSGALAAARYGKALPTLPQAFAADAQLLGKLGFVHLFLMLQYETLEIFL